MALEDILRPSLIELGKIKIGTLGEERQSRKGGTYRLPQKIDHFLITTTNRKKDGTLELDERLMDGLKADYADDDGFLRQVPIMLLSNELTDVLQCAYVYYRGKQCFARSDGRIIQWFYDPKTGEKLDSPHEVDWEPGYEKKELKNGGPLFKKNTILSCVIATGQARWGGVYKFRTTSTISGNQLYGSLIHLQGLTGGVLVGMPLRLVVRPVQVMPQGKLTTVYVVHCELRGSDLMAIQQKALEVSRFQLENKERLQSVQRQYRKLLTAPGLEDEDEQAAVSEEFYPEGEMIEPEDVKISFSMLNERSESDGQGNEHTGGKREVDGDGNGEADKTEGTASEVSGAGTGDGTA